MAGFVNPVSMTAPPDWQAQQQDIQRRMAMAQAMQEQGLEPSGGTQMAGPIAIKNSWTQGLAKAMKVGVGAWQQGQLLKEQRDLYQNQQDTYSQAGSDLMKSVTPRAVTAAQPGMIDEVGGINDPGQPARPAYTPDQGDLGKAYMAYLTKTGRSDLAAPFALQNAQRQIMMAQMLAPDSPASAALGAGAAGGDVGPTNTNAARINSGAGPTIGGIPQALAARLMAADPSGKLLAESQAGLFKQGMAPVVNRGFGVGTMVGGQYRPDPASLEQALAMKRGEANIAGQYETVPVTSASGAVTPTFKAQLPGFGQPPGAAAPGQPSGAQAPPPAFGPGMTPAGPNEPVAGPPQTVSQLPTGDQAAARQAQSLAAAGQPAAVQGGDPWTSMPKLAQPQGLGQSTYQRSIAEGSGKAASDLSKKYGDLANTANQRMATNNQALELVDRADTGPLAAQIGDVKNWLVSRFGVPENDFQNTPSATASLQKDLVNAATQRAKQQFGSRITQSEVMLMLNRGAPNVDMTKAAIKYLVSTDNAQAQYSIKQANDLGEYLNRGGDPMRFEGWYSQTFPQTNAVGQVKLNTSGTPSLQELMDEAKRRGIK